ncbi:MAG TPA: SDR family oxidoreductase [Edaphobacter sp.]|nr:SDR family oxidoreductase [Edaphobacter sp.]
MPENRNRPRSSVIAGTPTDPKSFHFQFFWRTIRTVETPAAGTAVVVHHLAAQCRSNPTVTFTAWFGLTTIFGAALSPLTKSLGKETALNNIAMNCIKPAAAKTRIFGQITREHIDFMVSKIPRGRFVKVDEISSMVAWLVSEENSFTTGAVFDLSGGRATY